ncbi:hypothetical protein [Pseudomonas leptonychotis]|uniref:hypothetical protein n=1 Tax=Pseudomonas leptonychotis TaxID=2448482 RepID=UPI00386E4EE0
MSAKIIVFPSPDAAKNDPLDRLAALLSNNMAELPSADNEQVKLLRRIDRKLGQLVKALHRGGAI